MSSTILRLRPLEYAHVLDLNSNITYVEKGPKSVILQENQKITHGPERFVIIPPGHYCKISNPAKLPVKYGEQASLKVGLEEIRLHQEPFHLYPGEILAGGVEKGINKLPVIPAGKALKLEALADFDDNGTIRVAGDRWQIEGPCTFYPKPECKRIGEVSPTIILKNSALHLKAKIDLVDKNGNHRVTGEEWMVRKLGAYLPGVYEEIMSVVQSYVLTQNNGLYMTAERNLTDGLGKKRLAGEEWLVTSSDSCTYIPECGEKLVRRVAITVLSKDQFCIVLDPYDNEGKQQRGKKELRKGPLSFFLKPGETLSGGIQNIFLLQDDQALILSAVDEFVDNFGEEPIQRKPGDVWMIKGPVVYTPPVEVEVKNLRKPIALGKNEGIYVQNEKTGEVRTVMGPQACLLNQFEVLWKKELSPIVEKMLMNGGCWGDGDIRKLAYFESSVDNAYASGKRDKTRTVTYRVPPNSAVQVYDHRKQDSRVVFGPNLVVLEPSEEFNVLSLSAGKPKKENALKSLAIMLGPDYITDIIEVETLDHARLKIKYAANNKFDYENGNFASETKLFSVPDYIGFACRNIASRIRGRVARTTFDEFHRYSTRIVKEAVFGVDEEDNVRNALIFSENNMTVTNIDVQSIEPVDTQMRDSLLKSVQMAIEISTQSIERAASHEARRHEQTAKGNLEKNKLQNEKAAESARINLYELRAETAAVESSGQAKAEAEAQAEKTLIEGHMAIEAANLKAKALEIEENSKMEILEQQRKAEIEYMKTVNGLEIKKAKQMADIELKKSADLINAIGQDTITNIALAGPKAKVGLLGALGIRATLITDGKTPVNLYQAPNGAITPLGH